MDLHDVEEDDWIIFEKVSHVVNETTVSTTVFILKHRFQGCFGSKCSFQAGFI